MKIKHCLWFPLTVTAIMLHKTNKELNRFRIKILISVHGKVLKKSLEWLKQLCLEYNVSLFSKASPRKVGYSVAEVAQDIQTFKSNSITTILSLILTLHNRVTCLYFKLETITAFLSLLILICFVRKQTGRASCWKHLRHL